MLAEIAAANAAFGVLKTAIANGKEIADAASSVAQFVGAKESLQRKAQKKGGGSDLEEFMALEKIRQQEDELKQIMIYTGRPGLWNDWQKFQAKARVARREAEVAAMEKRRKIIDGTIIAAFIVGSLAVLTGLVLLILHEQGRL
tara:strand:+ start:143 stop:574 length:432 start_codon:yes stop_codon:yes gene_type:complete